MCTSAPAARSLLRTPGCIAPIPFTPPWFTRPHPPPSSPCRGAPVAALPHLVAPQRLVSTWGQRAVAGRRAQAAAAGRAKEKAIDVRAGVTEMEGTLAALLLWLEAREPGACPAAWARALTCCSTRCVLLAACARRRTHAWAQAPVAARHPPPSGHSVAPVNVKAHSAMASRTPRRSQSGTLLVQRLGMVQGWWRKGCPGLSRLLLTHTPAAPELPGACEPITVGCKLRKRPTVSGATPIVPLIQQQQQGPKGGPPHVIERTSCTRAKPPCICN